VTPAEGIETALQLFDLAVDLFRSRLRRERPGITDDELDEAVRSWVQTRPGAELGDGVGRVSTRFDGR
jgi:hypothetical protein